MRSPSVSRRRLRNGCLLAKHQELGGQSGRKPRGMYVSKYLIDFEHGQVMYPNENDFGHGRSH